MYGRLTSLRAQRSNLLNTGHEGDERIYTALVEQLEAGSAYTLQGHPILDEPWIAGGQYDTPLFYHPPGGPLLFLALGLSGSLAVGLAYQAVAG